MRRPRAPLIKSGAVVGDVHEDEDEEGVHVSGKEGEDVG
jgi:hypothetical protein